MVYAVRFLMGLASSVAYVNIGVYISETAHKSVRNAFGAFQGTEDLIGLSIFFTERTNASIDLQWQCIIELQLRTGNEFHLDKLSSLLHLGF